MKLYCATTNPGKLREFRLAASDISIETVPGLAEIPAPEETGATFEENAIAKALYYSQHAPGPVFVDDSGLAVDALDGAPGVYSARYAGENATDDENNHLLIERMQGVENRAARFICVVALAEAGRLIGTFRGTVKGILLDKPRGSNGFGYDPLFFHPPFNRTLAEVPPEKKFTVSHRGQALTQLLRYIATRPDSNPGSRRRSPPRSGDT